MLIVFITVCLALHMQSAVNLTFIGPYTVNILQYISNKMQLHTVYYIWKRLYMFRMVPPPIIRSANNCIYSIWYLSYRHWSECAVGGVRHPQHTQTGSNSSTIATNSNNSVTNTRCCRYSFMHSWWWDGVPAETCRAVSRNKCVTLHLVGYILECSYDARTHESKIYVSPLPSAQ